MGCQDHQELSTQEHQSQTHDASITTITYEEGEEGEGVCLIHQGLCKKMRLEYVITSHSFFCHYVEVGEAVYQTIQGLQDKS